MKTVSMRIREAMEEKGIRQSDLCRMTGINKSSIFYYCTGEHEPRGRNLYKISTALGVSPSWLIGADVEQDGTPTEDEELWAIREAIRRDENIRTLFSLGRNAKPSDVLAAIAVLKSLKGDNE